MRKPGDKNPKSPKEPPMLARKQVIVDSRPAAHGEHAVAKQVLVAKPQSGPVDYAALRKKAMARFPKVLAHLAK